MTINLVTSKVDPFDIEEFIVDIFCSAEKNLIGISPVVTQDWAKVVSKIARDGVKVSLIINSHIFEKVGGSGYRDFGLLSNPNVRLFINDEIGFGFVSNGETISLAFFDSEGLDIRNKIMARGKQAANWGEELFEHYRGNSKLPEKLYQSLVDR